MGEAKRQRLKRLIAWRPALGVISAYFDIDRGDRSAGWRVALRDRLDELPEPGDREGKLALRETVKRVQERFDSQSEPPPGRAQIGFVEVARKAGTEDWSSLQIPPRDPVVVHAPRPLLRPLIDLLERGRARPVLAISSERIHGWIWSRGRLDREPVWDDELGIYPGHERKAPSIADPARGQATSSSGRDQFGQRLEENRKRFLHEAAKRFSEDERVRGTELIAIGEAPYLDEFATAIAPTVEVWRLEGADVIGEKDGAIAERVGPEIERAASQREAELTKAAIDASMARGGRGALGANETSEALAEGRVEHLLLDCGQRFPLEELSRPAREAATQDGQLDGAELMIELALRTSADVTPIGGEVAETLREHGAVAALLRY